jgi:glycosyltransferase involved in cell wall biosynthesis
VVLFLHNRYRTTGGEERVVEQLLRLVREHMEEPAQLLVRDSATLGRLGATRGLLRGGTTPGDVAKAIRLSGARVLHAHNLHPAFGWRALAAAREQGARVVLHLHQYRLVCANGVCFTGGRECTRCHGRNTLPGIARNCRGSRAEALTYGAALALWQRRILEHADAVIVPSVFARERLRELGAPLDWERVHVLPPPVGMAPIVALGGADADAESAGPRRADHFALVVSRLAPEKGIDVAIEACRRAGVPLVVAGDGPELSALQASATGGDVVFAGRVDDAQLTRLRANAALAIVPSRSGETFGMAAAEAMAAGVPVVASRVGALPELVEQEGLVEPGDPIALAGAIERRWEDRAAAERGRARVRELCSPDVVARGLADVYRPKADARSGAV